MPFVNNSLKYLYIEIQKTSRYGCEYLVIRQVSIKYKLDIRQANRYNKHKEVNVYEHAISQGKQDLTHLSWSVFCNSPGTARSFLKSYSELGERKRYYKLSNFDNFHGVVGHECVNELIVNRLLSVLGIFHLSYQLIPADVRVDGKYMRFICAHPKSLRCPVSQKLRWMLTKNWNAFRKNVPWIFVSGWVGKLMFDQGLSLLCRCI